MVRYSHRQSSFKAMLIVPVAAVFLIGVLLVARQPPAPLFIPVAVIAIVAAIVATFSTLIIEVNDSGLTVGFLFGMMRRHIPFDDIVRAERATIPWWYGKGVQYGWKATSYLIRQGPAIELTLKSGRPLRIGTDDPDALLAALRR